MSVNAGNKTDNSTKKEYRRRTRLQEILHRLRRNKGAMIGLAFLVVMLFVAVFADVLFDYEADVIAQNIAERLQWPSGKHWFGTDELGRDLFARIMYGTRYSLPVGFIAVMVALFFGVILGSIAGYFGGRIDDVIMRLLDIFYAVPAILLAIAIVNAMGVSTFSLCVAVGASSIPTFARITRAAVLSVRGQEFIESEKAIGASSAFIIFRHVLPNCLSPIIVQTTLRMGSAIISCSSLSYLGLGVPEPAPEWGSLLSAGRSFMRDYSYITIFPGLMIMVTVIAFNLLGDGLRDAMDPKLKR